MLIDSALLGATGFAFGGIVSPLVSLGDMMTSTGILFVSESWLMVCFDFIFSRLHRILNLLLAFCQERTP